MNCFVKKIQEQYETWDITLISIYYCFEVVRIEKIGILLEITCQFCVFKFNTSLLSMNFGLTLYNLLVLSTRK